MDRRRWVWRWWGGKSGKGLMGYWKGVGGVMGIMKGGVMKVFGKRVFWEDYKGGGLKREV